MSTAAHPPVGPDSDPADIRAWIAELERIREERAHEPDIVRMIDSEHDRALVWLNGRGGEGAEELES